MKIVARFGETDMLLNVESVRGLGGALRIAATTTVPDGMAPWTIPPGSYPFTLFGDDGDPIGGWWAPFGTSIEVRPGGILRVVSPVKLLPAPGTEGGPTGLQLTAAPQQIEAAR